MRGNRAQHLASKAGSGLIASASVICRPRQSTWNIASGFTGELVAPLNRHGATLTKNVQRCSAAQAEASVSGVFRPRL